MGAAVLEVRYQKRGDTFGIYSAFGGGWPELLEGGIATLEAAEARLLELERAEAARAAAAEMRILMEGGARVVYSVKAAR